MKNNVKIPIIAIAASIVIAVVVLIYGFFIYSKPQIKGTTQVKQMALTASFTADGTVKSSQDVGLSFERGGRVSSIVGDVGTSVSKGQVIATVNSSDLQAQLEAARVALQGQQIKLQNLQSNGSANSDLSISIANAKNTFITHLVTSYSDADSALATYVDILFLNPRSNAIFGTTVTENGTVYSISAPQSMLMQLNSERQTITNQMNAWNAANVKAQASESDDDIAAAYQQAKQTFTAIQTLLADIAMALNSYTGTDSTSLTLYNGYKASIATARSSVNTSSTGLNTAQQTYATSKAPASAYDISLQQVAVSSAQAQVDAVQSQIAQGIIRSPIDGVITEEDVKVGETASANTPVIHVMSNGQFQIEAYVSEAKINQVAVGNHANVTLDAQSVSAGTSTVYSATVVAVDPAQTVVNGTNSYKVTLQFDQSDSAIKSGMSVSINFQTGSVQNALVVPQSAVITENNSTYVLISNGSGAIIKRPVTVGITDSNGYEQITSGLSVGDQVITFGNQ